MFDKIIKEYLKFKIPLFIILFQLSLITESLIT